MVVGGYINRTKLTINMVKRVPSKYTDIKSNQWLQIRRDCAHQVVTGNKTCSGKNNGPNKLLDHIDCRLASLRAERVFSSCLPVVLVQ